MHLFYIVVEIIAVAVFVGALAYARAQYIENRSMIQLYRQDPSILGRHQNGTAVEAPVAVPQSAPSAAPPSANPANKTTI